MHSLVSRWCGQTSPPNCLTNRKEMFVLIDRSGLRQQGSLSRPAQPFNLQCCVYQWLLLHIHSPAAALLLYISVYEWEISDVRLCYWRHRSLHLWLFIHKKSENFCVIHRSSCVSVKAAADKHTDPQSQLSDLSLLWMYHLLVHS